DSAGRQFRVGAGGYRRAIPQCALCFVSWPDYSTHHRERSVVEMAIQKLGHVGIYANDLENMRDFYSRVIGLHIADESANAVFMSSDPDREHHEFVLFRSSGPEQQTCVQQ